MDRKRERHMQPQGLQDDNGHGTLPKAEEVRLDLDVSQRDRDTPTTANEGRRQSECF